jgi:hypothetical protein
MTEQLLHETRIALTRLAQEQKVSVPTAWRWSTRGVKGHTLETLSVGGRKYTTREAFSRFVSRTSGEKVVQVESPRQRQRAIDQAERRAEQLGV